MTTVKFYSNYWNIFKSYVSYNYIISLLIIFFSDFIPYKIELFGIANVAYNVSDQWLFRKFRHSAFVKYLKQKEYKILNKVSCFDTTRKPIVYLRRMLRITLSSQSSSEQVSEKIILVSVENKLPQFTQESRTTHKLQTYFLSSN